MSNKPFLLIGIFITIMLALSFIHTGRGPMLGSLDIAMFRAINQGPQNPMLTGLAEISYNIGSSDTNIYLYLFLLVILLLFISIIRNSRELRRLVIILAIALLISVIIIDPLKSIYGIARPYSYLTSTYVYNGEGWLHSNRSLSYGNMGDSFPSGHAIVTFTILGVLWVYKRIRVPLFIVLALISFLIVYVGSHYVSDTIAGGATGFMIGYLVQKAAQGAPG